MLRRPSRSTLPDTRFPSTTLFRSALHGEQRVLRIGDRLALGRLADEAFAVLGEGDHRRGGAGALGVLDNLGGFAIHDGDTGLGGTEVDANAFGRVDIGRASCRERVCQYV